MKNKTLNIAIITHSQFVDDIPVYGPADSICEFLRKNFDGKIFFLQHSIYLGHGSVFTIFNNNVIDEIYNYNFHRKLPNIIRYFIDFFLTIRLLWKNPYKVVIAIDPLNFFYVYFLKILTVYKTKIVFFTVDYGYKRFNNFILNQIYYRLDRFAVKFSNILWNSSYKISDIRAKQGAKREKNIHIPNSPLFKNVNKKSIEDINRNVMVMVFSNYKLVDFSIIFNSLNDLIKEFPKIKVRFIGLGDFSDKVLNLVKNKKILKHIECLVTNTHQETLKCLSECAVGLECNTQTLYWNEFREPIKIREYMYFGLPIISKPGHALEEEIKKENIGFIVKNVDEFSEAVRKIFSNDNLYTKMRKKVLKVADNYDKEKILFTEFARLGIFMKKNYK